MDLGQFLYTAKKIEIQVFYFFTLLNRTAVSINDIFDKFLYSFGNFKFNRNEANNYEKKF